MLGASFCPDTQRTTVMQLKTYSHHHQKIGNLHGEQRRGAWHHMPRLISAPQPPGRRFDVRRAQQAQRHWQFGTPCILACWAESWGPTSADGGGGWESGPRRRGPALPGRLVCPVPHLHVAGEIEQLGTVGQSSGGCLEPMLPNCCPKRAPTLPEKP